MTVATQTESRPIGDFTRTERTLEGFAAGLLTHAGDDADPPLVVRSSGHGLDGATLEFLPAKNSMAARLRLEQIGDEDAEVAGWDLAFGHAGDAGPGAMLDDDHYAALGDAAESSVDLQGGAGSVPLTPDGANIFIVGSDLTTLADGLPGGAAPCVCAFMEWGVWGGSADYELPGGDARRDFVHMGTWVAGVAPTIEELPTDLQATYSGHVLGEVARDTGEGWARYVQGGSMTMDFDFRDRTGNLAIEFDGKSFGGTMHGHGREFGGNLSGSGVTGAAAGAFFKGPKSPVQGVGGDWHVRADDYRAGGAMVGEQVDAAAAH
jgi:hypothetical protein